MANTSLRENTPSMTVNGKGKGCSTAHSSSAGTVHILYSLTLLTILGSRYPTTTITPER